MPDSEQVGKYYTSWTKYTGDILAQYVMFWITNFNGIIYKEIFDSYYIGHIILNLCGKTLPKFVQIY